MSLLKYFGEDGNLYASISFSIDHGDGIYFVAIPIEQAVDIRDFLNEAIQEMA